MKLTTEEAEAFIADARAKGLTITETRTNAAKLGGDIPAATKDEPTCGLLPSLFTGSSWIIGVETRSETNERSWKLKSNRTKVARAAVCLLFGRTLANVARFAEHYHSGHQLGVRLTRLAPRKLDAGNVAAALKAVEDAAALVLGADDGDPRWVAAYQQEHNPKMGVRIEFDLLRVR